MGYTAEEIKIKLGLDDKELDEGTRRSLAKLSNFSKETEHTFVKGANAAKGFKKVLNEITEQSPLMGNALRLAISPVGGAFVLAATGIALATKALADWNAKLDSARDRAAKPIWDIAAASEAGRNAGQSGAIGQAEFEAGLRGKGVKPPDFITGKSKEEMMTERALLSGRVKRLDDRIRAMVGDDANKAKRGATLQQRFSDFQGKVSEGESHRAGLQETENEPTGKWWDVSKGGIAGAAWRTLQKSLGIPNDKSEATRQLDELTKYRIELKRAKEDLDRFNTSEKQKAIELKNSRGELTGLITEIKNLDNAIGVSASPLRPGSIDASTGGYAYRPLVARSIGYKPLPGSLGYNSSPSAKTAAETNDALQLVHTLLAQLQSEGVRVNLSQNSLPE